MKNPSPHIMRSFVSTFALLATLVFDATIVARAADSTVGPSPALRSANPRSLSGGLYSALAAQGAFGGVTPRIRAAANGVVDLSKGKPPAVLDARVGVNVRLGDDPAALPATQRGQAEPHIARNVAQPDELLATFQEGRFATNGGSIDCGYALSRDGGLAWTRALIPQLTQASGGTFHRATDPVAAIGPQGDLYLATLASLDDAFGTAALVVSRSIDDGATWLAPSTVFQQTSPLAAPDKDWLAVNDFPGTPNPGRLVATWTNFTSTVNGVGTGDNLLAAVSDDRGATWSSPIAITPAGSLNQGTQPIFLPDGSLAVIYVTFPNLATTSTFSIQCKRSPDGGRTFPAAATTVVGTVAGYDDPDLRSGLFLPSATVARTTGEIFVTYVALVAGTPRVMVTKSADSGATWSTPAIASDNPATSGVDNPAIAVTPDGRTVSVFFIDKRLSPLASDGHAYFIDYYAALSFDGGATWQPNLRLTEMSSDVRYAPLTSEGYMLGDYLGIAPGEGLNIPLTIGKPCIAIWCDTRTGDADPVSVRFSPYVNADYNAWKLARFTRAELTDSTKSGPSADFDGDNVSNYGEFALGTDPRVKESGEPLVLSRPDADSLIIATVERAGIPPLITSTGASWFSVAELPPNLPDLTTLHSIGTPFFPLGNGAQPNVSIDPKLVWRTSKITGVSGKALLVTALVPTSSIYSDALYNETGPSVLRATTATTSRLINLSTRGQSGAGANQLIVGFVIDGRKNILVRAAGPALAAFGVAGTVADPSLSLVSGDPAALGVLTNDNWSQSSATAALFARLGAFPFPINSLDAALVQSLPAQSYTALVSGANSGTGTSIVEIYDADQTPGAPSGPRLVNLSSRDSVSTDNPLAAGFVIGGTQPRRVLLRAIGPSLTQFNVAGAIADPFLTLYQGNTIVATNDDWEISRSSAAIAATAQNVGAFALAPASLDAALLITLAPGAYTAVVTGVNGATGIALVEVYDAN